MPWILRRYSRKEYSCNKGIHTKPNKRRSGIRSNVISRVYRPVYGVPVKKNKK